MDVKAIADNMGLTEDEFSELMELFLDTSRADVTNLQTALSQGETQKVVEAAHSIKGAALNLGFREISELAENIEVNARREMLYGASGRAAAIKEKLEELAKTLG